MKYQIKQTERGDHILESVVPTNFGGDAVNYVFRGRLEDCEKVRDELVKGVSDEHKFLVKGFKGKWIEAKNLKVGMDCSAV